MFKIIRKIIVGIVVLSVLSAFGLYSIWKNVDLMPLTDIEETSKVLYDEMQKGIEETNKIYDFVETRLPYGSDSLYTLETGHESDSDIDALTREELHREVLDNFNLAIQHDDVDLFLNVITSDSIDEILNGEENIEKRLNLFSETVRKLNRNGLFEKAPYRFYIEERNKEADSGLLKFMYSDGKEVEVPFELELLGEDEDSYYIITTSISEMIALINSEN